MRIKKTSFLFYLAIFLLPFQTQYIYHTFLFPEGLSEYGKFSVFVTELLIVLSFLFSRSFAEKWHVESRKIMRGFFFCLAMVFLSLTFSKFYFVSLFAIGHLLIAGMIFLRMGESRINRDVVLSAFILGLVFPCLLGFYQYTQGFSPAYAWLGLAEKQVETPGVAVVATNSFRVMRAYGTFLHPNIFGGYLVTALFSLFFLAQSNASRTWMWITIPLTVLFSSTLFLTFSRSAWLAFLFASLVLFIGSRVYKQTISKRVIFLGCVCFSTLILFSVVFHAQFFARFDPSLHVEAISVSERTGQYQNFFEAFKQHPLVGSGFGTSVFHLESMIKHQPVWWYQPIHNVFLLILLELGIVGFMAFGYFVKQVFSIIWQKRKTIEGIFSITLLISLCSMAFFDHYLFSLWSGLSLSAFILAISVRLTHES